MLQCGRGSSCYFWSCNKQTLAKCQHLLIPHSCLKSFNMFAGYCRKVLWSSLQDKLPGANPSLQVAITNFQSLPHCMQMAGLASHRPLTSHAAWHWHRSSRLHATLCSARSPWGNRRQHCFCWQHQWWHRKWGCPHCYQLRKPFKQPSASMLVTAPILTRVVLVPPCLFPIPFVRFKDGEPWSLR